MVGKASNASGVNLGRSVLKFGHTYTFFQTNQYDSSVDPNVASSGQEKDYGMWATAGSGVSINVTGSVLFDSRQDNGSINSLFIINRGPNPVSFEINDEITPSGAYTLLSGEEADMSNVPEIRKLVAFTASTGVDTVLAARGSYIYNAMTI